jgi:alanine racemase
MANSAAILSLPESLFDVVRPGIMLYGASPFNDNHFTLKPGRGVCCMSRIAITITNGNYCYRGLFIGCPTCTITNTITGL